MVHRRLLAALAFVFALPAVSFPSANAATGPVLSSGTSVDEAIVRYDGTTGMLIQSYVSGAPTISDWGDIHLQGNLINASEKEIAWPTAYDRCTDFPVCSPSGRIASRFILGVNTQDFDGQIDHVLMLAYNYAVGGMKINPADAALKLQIEGSYWDSTSKVQWQEINLDYWPIGGTQWRPLYTRIATGGSGAGSELNKMDWQWRTAENSETFHINDAGDGGIEVGEFFSQSSHKALITQSIRSTAVANASQGATKSVVDLNLDATSAAGFEYVGDEGQAIASNFSQSNSFTALVGTRGLASINGPSDGSRTVTNYAAGLEGRCWITSSGSTPVSLAACLGGRFQASAHGTGSNVSLPIMAGVFVASPALKGAGTTINHGAGIWLSDQKGYGSMDEASLRIDPQTGGGGSGARGNLLMLGGGWDDGHLQLQAGHIWFDKTARIFRTANTSPASEGAGNAVVTGSGATTRGPLLWGATGTSCDSVCSSQGLVCQSGYSLGNGSAKIACSSTSKDKACMCR
jgi:hypothetical protein